MPLVGLVVRRHSNTVSNKILDENVLRVARAVLTS